MNFLLVSYKKEHQTNALRLCNYFCTFLYLFSFHFFLQLLCISLVSLIFRYSAQILLENALFCRQNARLKNRLFCSKFC